MTTLTKEQFARLMAHLQPTNATSQASFAQRIACFADSRDPQMVEEFVNVTSIFRRCMKIADADALCEIPSHHMGPSRGLNKRGFTPKKPDYQVYVEIFKTTQDKATPTDLFVCQKRALYS
ncbi:activity-regulated cytoskeleton associated protein 2-like [Agrilus planipennis]|uniref:Activity-regulated cytoskeleton associated protein 2-like n=1 Tax=Agrilus planipennis TaxID=224129 RepID=A0A7F5R601_AGRPL|nr:activity-regulated cytoskeleton associated protein 2-like [Agrilus planipennis]